MVHFDGLMMFLKHVLLSWISDVRPFFEHWGTHFGQLVDDHHFWFFGLIMNSQFWCHWWACISTSTYPALVTECAETTQVFKLRLVPCIHFHHWCWQAAMMQVLYVWLKPSTFCLLHLITMETCIISVVNKWGHSCHSRDQDSNLIYLMNSCHHNWNIWNQLEPKLKLATLVKHVHQASFTQAQKPTRFDARECQTSNFKLKGPSCKNSIAV